MTIEELKVVITATTAGLKKGVADAKAQLRGLKSEVNGAQSDVDKLNNQSLEGLKSEFKSTNNQIKDLTSKIKEAEKELAKLSKKYNSYFGSVSPDNRDAFENMMLKSNPDIASEKSSIDNLKANIDGWNTELAAAKEHAAKLKDEIEAANTSSKKLAKSGNAINKAFNSLSSIFKRMVIRKILMAIITDIKECIGLLARFDKMQGNLHGYNQALSNLKSQFKQLGANITIAFANIITTLEPAITAIITLINWVVDAIHNLIAALGELGGGQKTYTAVNPDYWKDYAAALEESDTSAKKLYKTIAGFDELNTLDPVQDKTNSTTLPGDLFIEKDIDETKAAVTGLGLLALAIPKVVDLVNKLKTAFGNKNTVLDVQNGLEATSLATLGEYALVLGGATASVWSFANMWQEGWNITGEIIKDLGLAVTAVGATLLGVVSGPVAAAIAAGVALVSSLAIVIHDNWDSIKAWSKETWENVTQSVSNWATESWDTVSNWITETSISFQTWRENAKQTISTWAVETGTNISNWATTTGTNIANWVSTTATNIGDWANETFSTVSAWNKNVGDKIDNWAANTLTRVLTWATEFNNSLSEGFSNAWTSVTTWCTNAGEALISWAGNACTNIASGMSSFVDNIGEGLSVAFENISNWASSALTTLREWASSAAIAVGNWASGLVQSIGNALSSAWSSVKSFFSSVASAFNSGEANSAPSIIDRLKTTAALLGTTLAVSAGMFVKKLFSGASFPTFVPAYANGGVISSPTIGLMGEYAGASNNPEIVAPQSMIRDIIDSSNSELASVYTQIGRQIIAAIENKDLSVSIGDNEIAQAAARGNEAYYRRTGVNLIGR